MCSRWSAPTSLCAFSLTTLFRSTQCVEQGGARVEGQSALLTVDDKVHWMTHRAPPSARGREVESRADERGWQPSQAASCVGSTVRRGRDTRFARREPGLWASPGPRGSDTVAGDAVTAVAAMSTRGGDMPRTVTSTASTAWQGDLIGGSGTTTLETSRLGTFP